MAEERAIPLIRVMAAAAPVAILAPGMVEGIPDGLREAEVTTVAKASFHPPTALSRFPNHPHSCSWLWASLPPSCGARGRIGQGGSHAPGSHYIRFVLSAIGPSEAGRRMPGDTGYLSISFWPMRSGSLFPFQDLICATVIP